MDTLVLERQGCRDDIFRGESEGRQRTTRRSEGTDAYGGLTLDDLITGVWEGLAVRDTVCCPVCGGMMVSHTADSGDVCEGGCRDCGTVLS
jgi:hypothetical protein